MVRHPRDWRQRGKQDLRFEAPQRMPAIIRKLVFRHEFKPGSVLSVFEDNERATYEVELKRDGLRTRSGRYPKGLPFDPKWLLDYVLQFR